ncbi:hypothetical protein B7494_g3212 [Chlorociboria aeruginascens]|nr:hypothetical protein B7494_g3212 [Chlorociboria aeruginascens]
MYGRSNDEVPNATIVHHTTLGNPGSQTSGNIAQKKNGLIRIQDIPLEYRREFEWPLAYPAPKAFGPLYKAYLNQMSWVIKDVLALPKLLNGQFPPMPRVFDPRKRYRYTIRGKVPRDHETEAFWTAINTQEYTARFHDPEDGYKWKKRRLFRPHNGEEMYKEFLSRYKRK